MRLVFDTNVYIAALKASGYCAQLLNLVVDSQSGYELWASPFILDELERKLIEGKRPLTNKKEAADLIWFIRNTAQVTEILEDTKIKILRDPKDNHILMLAKKTKSDLIITMDQDLLTLKQFEGTAIVHPKNFGYMQPKS
jgi:putative PIN family toxin of toxin-antitoxin system